MENEFFQEEKIAPFILTQFNALNKKYTLITVSFLFALLIETILFLVFLPVLFKTALFSMVLAAWLITFFGYFVARNYLKTEKESAFDDLAVKFKRGVHSVNPSVTPIEQKELAARKLIGFADNEALKNRLPPQKFNRLKEQLINFLERNPKQTFKLTLYRHAKDELAGVIRLDPCSLSAHLSLARIKERLGEIYKEMGNLSAFKKSVTESAEELKVLLELSPDDSTLYLELARCYSLLGDLSSEKAILEKGKELTPLNGEILLRLGKLYFSGNEAAKGFRVYESLKTFDPLKSEALIAFYQ